MLHELRVHNLALVDALHFDVSERGAGLIVLTGETGAGKSIILQAIHLLGGGRSSASWVRNDCDQAMIEALFEIGPEQQPLLELLDDQALRDGSGCIVRRIITRQGRSKLYINDQLVTARIASDLAEGLVNIASQHDNQQLLNVRHHVDFLDSYGELWPLRSEYSRLFRQWQKISSELRQLLEREQDKEQQKDFFQFQLEEIESAQLVVGEDEELIRERDLLKSSATVVAIVDKAHQLFAGKILDTLAEVRKDLGQLAELDPDASALAERAISACYEVADIEQELSAYGAAVPTDVSRMEGISERLALLKQLQRKYGATLEEVLAFAGNIRQELVALENLEGQIDELELELEKVSTKALLRATELSQYRKEAARKLEQAMEEELASLSFHQACFRVQLKAPEGLGMEGVQLTGLDTVEFRFSANPGEPDKPLAKVASGGELSRLMLAMKCILARRDQVDTVIFDEVDAGISGQAAEAVAEKIRQLAGHHQVFCITHLPQIAAGADIHFKIEKQVRDGRTRTVLVRLDAEARVAELARMLGGSDPSGQTMVYARELVERKQQRSRV
ncbi:DNA repair protein RecN [Desulfogranum mediterraneum]|uniref:DNA repair protein RecN n=1 Tax=Desulfogranum mediterraneum TaxID=160661 RepID=UPI00040ED0AB|nr:DNA repair protein RecN [Desulfogranum mediterraneum]